MGDVENRPSSSLDDQQPSDGYPAVANFIAQDPDNETFVFRKFNRLTARVLLQQQAELAVLEADLDQLDRESAQRNDSELNAFMRSWDLMQQYADTSDECKKRVELADKIEVKLAKYQKTLLRQSHISILEHPSDRVLSAYRRALHGSSRLPNVDSKLGKQEREILEDATDLVALKVPAYKDALSRTVRNHWPFQAKKDSRKTHEAIWHFEERFVVWLVGVVSTTVAAILLIGSILALYWVTDPDRRLALVICFIVLFAIGMSVCTGASRDSIFAATAAYSAVLVVFVSGDLGNANVSSK